MNPDTPRELVLAIHPTYRGFGWILFEGPSMPVDWGIASAKEKRSARSLARYKRILSRYHPKAIVFEEFEGRTSKRNERIQKLCRAMIHLASTRGIDTRVYTRESIRACIEGMGAATTRYEVAQTLAEQIPAIRSRLPRERKPWTSEDHRQCLFDAAALAVTFFAHNQGRA